MEKWQWCCFSSISNIMKDYMKGIEDNNSDNFDGDHIKIANLMIKILK